MRTKAFPRKGGGRLAGRRRVKNASLGDIVDDHKNTVRVFLEHVLKEVLESQNVQAAKKSSPEDVVKAMKKTSQTLYNFSQ